MEKNTKEREEKPFVFISTLLALVFACSMPRDQTQVKNDEMIILMAMTPLVLVSSRAETKKEDTQYGI